ncbi:class I adenylate-forming enzyme family protein [Paraburkholderia sp. GAS32]|uniref:class I adenylate-forming enzyme family protein n=1 Tax=Paraburkholderia sp. GAS32 TaxID=3035129 RepID=UPI003D22D016
MIIERFLQEVTTIDPDAYAVEAEGTWSTWGQLSALSRQVQALMNESGVAEGARVGLLLRSRAPHLAAFLACIASNRCAVAFNPLMGPERLAIDIASQVPTILIGTDTDLGVPEIAEAATAASIPMLQLPTRIDGEVGWRNSSSEVKPLAGRLNPEVLIEMLTSGTTGTPKRIALSRQSMDESFVQGRKYESGSKEDPSLRSGVRIVTAPLTHISGIFGALTTLADGRKLVLHEKFQVDQWVEAVERHGSKVANLPPTALRMILDAEVPRERLSSLIALRSGTAPVDPAIVDAFLDLYGIPVLVQYGATEFAGGVAGWTIKDFHSHYTSKRGSVGRMQPNVEARVVDAESHEVLPFGEEGILELRSSQFGDALKWVRTTDRAILDADNFLWIKGRADNAINRGGFKIHPDDIARAIGEHPAVKEAVVVGVPDRRLGEVPVAVMTLKQGVPYLESVELRTFLLERLLPYQIPASFKILSEIPRTPLLKPSAPDIKRLFGDRESE